MKLWEKVREVSHLTTIHSCVDFGTDHYHLVLGAMCVDFGIPWIWRFVEYSFPSRVSVQRDFFTWHAIAKTFICPTVKFEFLQRTPPVPHFRPLSLLYCWDTVCPVNNWESRWQGASAKHKSYDIWDSYCPNEYSNYMTKRVEGRLPSENTKM